MNVAKLVVCEARKSLNLNVAKLVVCGMEVVEPESLKVRFREHGLFTFTGLVN